MAAHHCFGAGAGERRQWLSADARAALEATVARIAVPGKGISACDESGRTIDPRFAAVGLTSTPELRRAYREALFTAPDAELFLTAVILDPETVGQKASDGTPFPALLEKRGLVPGVKPSLTVYKLPGTNGETYMQGLDGLAERCRGYYAAGCRFAKWRSPLRIDVAAGTPSALAIETNCRDLARYALICQAEGLVPIVEPDLVLKGAHTLDDALEANARVQLEMFRACTDYGVHLEGCLLKTNMVRPGKDCTDALDVVAVADANLRMLRRVLPVAVRSVNYLSGGLSLEDACATLAAINAVKQQRGGPAYAPWNLSFSWSSCIQLPLFQLCKTEKADASGLPRKAIQELYVTNLRRASEAAKGRYWEGDADQTW
mmetsp:Transcript_8529/g.25663  ORF Transcript_8529/g.25663 Transcript_8529/m.25663 type:complete len:375 (+) Transcript_8529:155-1279(+)